MTQSLQVYKQNLSALRVSRRLGLEWSNVLCYHHRQRCLACGLMASAIAALEILDLPSSQ